MKLPVRNPVLLSALVILTLISACSLPGIGGKDIIPTDIPTPTANMTMTSVMSYVHTLTAQPPAQNTAVPSVAPSQSQPPIVPPTVTPWIVTATPPAASATPWIVTATPKPVTATPWVVTATPKVITATVPVVVVTPIVVTATPKVITATPNAGAARKFVYSASYLSTPPTIDGVWDEWNTPQVAIGSVIYGGKNWTGEDDLGASYRIGWDMNYLYLAVKVKDDVYVSNAKDANLYKGDGIELLLDFNLLGDFNLRSLTPDDYQLGMSVDNPASPSRYESYLYLPRSVAGNKTITQAYVGQSGLYRMEAAIPWSTFGLNPYSGMRFGFAIRVSDNDDASQNVQQTVISNVPGNVLGDPTTWGEITFK